MPGLKPRYAYFPEAVWPREVGLWKVLDMMREPCSVRVKNVGPGIPSRHAHGTISRVLSLGSAPLYHLPGKLLLLQEADDGSCQQLWSGTMVRPGMLKAKGCSHSRIARLFYILDCGPGACVCVYVSV